MGVEDIDTSTPENLFHAMAHTPEVRAAMEGHTAELRLVFELYATLDTSTADATLRIQTMNVKEFHMLLTHCDLLDQTLTEAKMEEVFAGIQQSATYIDEEDSSD